MSMTSAEEPNTPIELPKGGFGTLPDEVLARQRKEDERRLLLVCERNGIPDGPDMCLQLALCYASKFRRSLQAPKLASIKHPNIKPLRVGPEHSQYLHLGAPPRRSQVNHIARISHVGAISAGLLTTNTTRI